ncbi:TRIC cation channel family protein [Streptomyces javensis]|uniref:trimeric intracellular cation channel family protein n=1 Tax=Streptomyces javensis TaxID=114698 RepID=UPI003F4D4E4E
MHQVSTQAQYLLDLLGIFGFALSSAYLGVRKDFNLFGTLVLAEAAGLGGGLVRDLVLRVPSIAFTDPGYPLAPLAAALLAYRGKPLHRQPRLFDLLDAVGLGLFSVTGTVKGLQHGMEAVPSAALGVITAMGGGILASAVAKELPSSLRWDSDLYAAPAIAGAGAAATLHETGALDVMTASGAALTAFTLRLLALHFHWRTGRSAAWRAASPQLSPLPGADAPPAFSTRTTVADTMRLRVIRTPQGHGTGQRSAAPLDDTMRLRAISPPPDRAPERRSPAAPLPEVEATRLVQPGPVGHRLPSGPRHSVSPQPPQADGHPTRGPEGA